jgi:hypothetical protein
MVDVKDRGLPSLPNASKTLLNQYLENQQAQPIAATSRRPAYRAIVGQKAGKDGADFSDIQRAINHVNAIGGGTVLLNAGTYTMTDDLILYSKVTLSGEGAGATILDFNNTTKVIKLWGDAGDLSNLVGYSDEALQDVVVKNLCIKNSRNGTGVIQFRYIRNPIVKDCLFDDAGYGVFMSTCIIGRVYDNTFYNLETAATMTSGFNIVKGNYIDAGTVGILLASNSVCYGNRIINGGDAGINATGSDIIIYGNQLIDYTDTAINVQGDDCEVYGNILEANDANYGIYTTSDNINVHSNKIRGDQDYGIYCHDSNNSRFSGNNIDLASHAASTGIYLAGASCTGNRVVDNNILNAATGIRANANCDRAIITNNNPKDCTTPVNFADATNLTQDNNIVA